ncbi:MAG: nucleotide exchange factor GrpE [Gaiellaceae bacterium]
MTDQPFEDRVEGEHVSADVAEEPAVEEQPAPAPDDSYLRLAADFDNYRKRVAREHAELSKRANERLLNELLPVLDDLERALEAADRHEEAKLVEGVKLVEKSLRKALEKEGLAEIATEGPFDPHVHEALLTQVREGAEPGSVLEVVQRGYRVGDKVVRPARVIVAE